VLHPRDSELPDRIWVAELEPDMAVFGDIENDSLTTRCVLLQTYFPERAGVTTWSVRVDTVFLYRVEWPTDIWVRRPTDDVLLHPAVRAVSISVEDVAI
jgi:hypothetical protein